MPRREQLSYVVLTTLKPVLKYGPLKARLRVRGFSGFRVYGTDLDVFKVAHSTKTLNPLRTSLCIRGWRPGLRKERQEPNYPEWTEPCTT